MRQVIEEFCKAHQSTIAALGAVGTVAAVITSLAVAFLAKRANRTQIKAHTDLTFIMHSSVDGRNPPTYVTASITNKGIMPLRIPLSFFHWRTPFRRETWLLLGAISMGYRCCGTKGSDAE